MKKVVLITLFGALAFANCGNSPKNKSGIITTDTISPTARESTKHPSSKFLESLNKERTMRSIRSHEDWKRKQDSIRNIILSGMENEILKNSILQEACIKNIVWTKNDTLFFSISFDLHAFDCIAPDCYSTDLKFNFKFKDSLRFPDKLPFTIHEYGCVEKEINLSGVFQLMESDKNFITYHSERHKSTLIIFKSDNRKETIYYFVGVGPNTIKRNLVDKIIDAYDEEDPKSIVPYESTVLINPDYELFLKKKP